MKILIIDELHPYLKTALENLGCICDDYPDISSSEVASIIPHYQGLVLRAKIKVDKHLIDKATQLKFIARAGAGMETIDVKYATSKGIKCISSPEGNRGAVAEHAIGMLLSLLNKLKKSDSEIRQGIWNRRSNWGVSIEGKTVGIIGYGNTGSEFANRLSSFGVNILAYDKYKSGFSNDIVTEVNIDQLKQEADIISLHLPLTEETKFLVDKPFIEGCNKSFYLINTSRGAIVKTEALVNALKTNKILGCCLDVLEYEQQNFESLFKQDLPSDFSYLINSENAILSPHIAGWTVESFLKHSEVLFKKIAQSL